tara:strand:+ start:49 stop:1617 length:1569 start_codon:yes stop_codon:yes gene_type:complete
MIWGLVLEAAFYMLCIIPELIFALFYIGYQWLANFSKAAVSLVTGKSSNDKNQNDLQKEKDAEDEFAEKVYDNILNWEFTLYKKIKSLLLEDAKEVKDGELVSINGKEINVIDARKTRDKDVFRLLVGFSVTLVSGFVLAVILLWLFLTMNGEAFGFNPPQSLVTWEDEYRDITGINEIEGLDGTGISLCIVDSGIDTSHPDLKNINLMGWNDVINSSPDPYDDDGHGTAMAGIIVADGGLNGIAKNVNLYVAKAINSDGSGTDDGIAEAVDWCVSQDSDIISLSLGGGQGIGGDLFTTDSLEIAVENAIDQGVYVVAAAGNDGENDDGDVSSPGSVENVICVGGVTRLGNLWSGSSEGDNNGRFFPNPILPRNDPDKKPEIIAPGLEVPVLVTGTDSWWGWSSGTSASTAWVSGGLALFLQEYPEFQRNTDSDSTNIEEVKILLSENSQMKNGQSQHDDHFGYGIFRIDSLIDAVDSNSSNIENKIEMRKIPIQKNIFDIFQIERRITASVPPDNSMNAIE